MSKIKIFLDCDDTILNSSETVIEILNKKNGTLKTIEDLKDWGYKSIDKFLTPEDVNNIYDSDSFWVRVKFKKEFVEFYNENKNKFKWIIVTKGNTVNLEKKRDFLDNFFGNNYEFIPMNFNIISGFDKTSVNMENGIQIDDKTECLLGTNAACKILLTNDRQKYWNKIPSQEDNLYQANNWEEIVDLLKFFRKNKKFVTKCYEEM